MQPIEPNQPKIIIICGPTGVGKTTVAIHLARVFQGEIVSADSMQIYRLMDIGTAKPTLAEQSAVPHHIIDIIQPNDPIDAAVYAKKARAAIADLVDRAVLPFVVGGTGLYIKALLHGLSRARPADPERLARLKKEAEEKGSLFLHRRLQSCDPASAAKIHANDTFRIIRALEIYEKTGQTMTACHATHRFSHTHYQSLKIGLHMNRTALYHRIDKRVDEMIEAGLLAEVNRLLKEGYTPNLKSMQSIGYRHMTEYLMGKTNWEEAISRLKADSRRYAKRQLTWFKADPKITWFEPDQVEDMQREVALFVNT